jgi:hypothetical protein
MNDEHNLSGLIWLSDGSTPPSATGFAIWVEYPPASDTWYRFPDSGWYTTSDPVSGQVWYSMVLPDEWYNVGWGDGSTYRVEVDATPWGEYPDNCTSNGTGSAGDPFPAPYDPTNPNNINNTINYAAGGGFANEQQWDVRTVAPRDLIPTNVTVDGMLPIDYPAGIPVGGGSTANLYFNATNIGLLETGGTFNAGAWLCDANGVPFDINNPIAEFLGLGPLNEYGNTSGNGYDSGVLTFPWVVPLAPGDYYINITVDSGYTISEINETNNTIILHFIVGPDLVPVNIFVDGIQYPDWPQISPIILPAPGQWIHIIIDLTNVGATTSGVIPFNVAFYNVSITGGHEPIDPPFNSTGDVFSDIKVGDVVFALEGWWYAPAPGEFRINLTVDYGGAVAELNESNNTYVLRVLVGPDIIPTNVTVNGLLLSTSPSAPIPVGLGQTVAIGTNATNIGFSPTGGTIWTGWYNSTIDGSMLNQPYYNASAPELNGSMDPGSSYFVTGGYWTAPSIAGVYYVTVYVDIGNDTFEFNETNNSFVICFLVGPDLTYTNVTVNGNYADTADPSEVWYVGSGETVMIGTDAVNVGASPTGLVPFTVSFTNCTATGQPLDPPFGQYVWPTGLLILQSTTPIIVPWLVPNFVGDLYVNITIDYNDNVSESVETNNTYILHFRVGPDYIPWNISVNGMDANDPNAVWPAGAGEVIVIGANASNIGFSNSSILFNISFANSTDPLNPFYVEYGIPGVPAGDASSHYTAAWTAPNAVGDFYIIITVDYGNSTWELNEFNNTFIVHIVIGPDYIPTDVRADGVPVPAPDPLNPIPVGAGIPVILDVQTENVGFSGVAPGILYNISFSLGGVRFDNVTGLPGLANGTLSGLQTGVWIPPNLAGIYAVNITVDSDNSTWELNEYNNTVTLFFIVAPDYIPGYITVDGQYAWDEAILWNVTPGVPVTIGVNCTNVGLSGVNSSITYTISFYNSTATRVIGSEFDNVTLLPGLLSGGESGEQIGGWIPPSQPGDYYVLVVVDSTDTTSEINELNNTFLIHFVIGPDLIPTNVMVDGQAATSQSQIWYVGPGMDIIIGANATNVGFSGTGTGFNMSLYNTSIAGSAIIGDANFFDIIIVPLNPGEDSGHWTWLWRVPWPAGDYYVNITVDRGNATWELNEFNNTFVIHFVVAPDLTPTNVSVDGLPITSYPSETVIVYPGQIITINANATNVGPSSTGVYQFNMTFWNSSAAGQTFGLYLLDSGLLGPLNASGFTSDFSVVWVAPSPDKPTDYYINITVDSTWAISEWVEANNTYILHIRVDAPDLTPDRIEVRLVGDPNPIYTTDEPSTLPIPFVSEEIFVPVGIDIDLTFIVANIGGVDQAVGTNITAYNVSGIGGAPVNNPFYESGPFAVLLPSGVSAPFTIIWPNPGPGSYYINITVDYNGTLDIGGRIIELNESNNTFTLFFTVTSAPITTLRAGNPRYQPGIYWYVNSSTELNFTVTGQNPPLYTWYRITDNSTGSVVLDWTNYTAAGTNFTMIWGEGTYWIEYNSSDSVGNMEPIKSRTIIVDDSLPQTNIIIGSPQYRTNVLDVLNITSPTPIDLSAVDWPLGPSPVGPANASGINGLPISGMFYRIQNLDNATYMTDWIEYAPGVPFFLDALWLDGNYSIEFNSTDNLGQKESPNNIALYLDNTGPVTTIQVGDPKWKVQPQDRVNVTSLTPFTLDAFEAIGSGANISTIEYRIIFSDGAGSSGWITGTAFDIATAFAQGDGNYTIQFRARDNLGNLGPTDTLDIYVDDTPPVTILTIGDPKYRELAADIWNITSATPMNLTAFDGPGAGVDYTQYRIYNLTYDSGWITYSGNFTMPGGLNDGVYTIEYGSFDFLGNYQDYTVDIFLDNSPPVTTIMVGNPMYPLVPVLNITGVTPLNLSATDGLGSGVATIYYRVYSDDLNMNVTGWTEYTPGTLSFDLTGLPDGNYTIIFNATDNLGNVEPNNFYPVYLDNTGPQTNISVGDPKYRDSPSDNWNVTSATPFTLIGDEAVGSGADQSTLEFNITFLDGGTWSGWIAGGAFDISSAFAQGDGNYSISFRCRDNLGNLGPENTITIYVDDSPPVSLLTVGDPKYRDVPTDFWNITSTTPLNLTADDGQGSGIASIYYRIYSEDVPGVVVDWTEYSLGTLSFFLTTLPDGNYTIFFNATDNLGITETIQSEGIYLDNTAPVTDINIGTPQHRADPINDILNISSLTPITFLPDDGPGCGTDFTMYRATNATFDSGWLVYPGGFTLPNTWSDGIYTIAYYSVDYLGNVETPNSYTLFLDNTPPVTIITVGDPKFRTDPSHYWNVTVNTHFTLSADDGIGSGVNSSLYQIDSLTPVVYNGSYFIITAPEGLHRLRYWTRDNLFNTEVQHEIYINVDNSPPVTDIVFGNPQYRVNQTADILNITDATPINITSMDGGVIPVGVDYIEYMIDDDDDPTNGDLTGWVITGAPFTLAGFPDGEYYIYYHAVDLLGNTEIIRNVTIIVDSSEPETTFDVIGTNHTDPGFPDVWWITPTTGLTLTTNDVGSPPVGLNYTAYRVDGVYHEFTVGIESIDISGFSNGSHTIQFSGVDFLGNTEPTRVVTVIFDDAGPDIDIQTPPDVTLPSPLPQQPSIQVNFSEATNLTIDAIDRGVPPGVTPAGVWYIESIIDPDEPGATWQTITPGDYNIFDMVVQRYQNQTEGFWHHNISLRAYDNLGQEGPTITIWFYIEGDVEPPLPPVLRAYVRGDDIYLEWEPSVSPDIHYYLIYRSATRTGFDFSSSWVDTSQNDDSGIFPLRTTWNDTNAVSASPEYYYTIRGVDGRGNIGPTSNIAGKVTMTFTNGYNAFALPLEPFDNVSAWSLLESSVFESQHDTVYRYDTASQQWIGRPKFMPSSINNFTLIMGESYMLYIDEDEIQYTFTGSTGTSIRYMDGVGEEESFRNSLSVEVDGSDVTLNWNAASGATGYSIYRADTRMGAGSLTDYDLDPIDDVDDQTLTWTDSSVAGNEYYYLVVAESTGREGGSTYALGVNFHELDEGYSSFSLVYETKGNLTYSSFTLDYLSQDADTLYYYNKEDGKWSGHPRFLPENINNGNAFTGHGYLIFIDTEYARFAVVGV